MKKLLPIISSIVIVLLSQAAAQESKKHPDKDIEEHWWFSLGSKVETCGLEFRAAKFSSRAAPCWLHLAVRI
jgi:hypothetical protein